MEDIFSGKSIWDDDSSDWIGQLMSQAEEEAREMQEKEEREKYFSEQQEQEEEYNNQFLMEDEEDDFMGRDIVPIKKENKASYRSSNNDYQETYDFFTKKLNYSDVHARAIAANLQQESGNKPLLYDDGANGIGGGGIAQWSPIRMKELKEFSNNNNLDWRDKQTQLYFIDYELKNKERKAGQSFFSKDNPEEATESLMKEYFRPSSNPNLNRLDKRLSYLNMQYGGGFIPSGLLKQAQFGITYNGVVPNNLDADYHYNDRSIDLDEVEVRGKRNSSEKTLLNTSLDELGKKYNEMKQKQEENKFYSGIPEKSFDLINGISKFEKTVNNRFFDTINTHLDNTISSLSNVQNDNNLRAYEKLLNQNKYNSVRQNQNKQTPYI